MNAKFTKRKMFIIATSIFLVTMATVLFVIGEGEIKVNHHDYQAFIINDFNELKDYTETKYRDFLSIEDREFVIVNNKREFVYITPNMEKIHGYKLSENIGLNALSLIHPKDLIVFAHTLLEYNKDLHPLKDSGPIRIKTIEGNYITYLLDLYPIFDKNNKKVASAVILKNISAPLGDKENNDI